MHNIITAIIAITPAQPKIATILLPNDIIIPANITPKATAVILVLKSSFKIKITVVAVWLPLRPCKSRLSAEHVYEKPRHEFFLVEKFEPCSHLFFNRFHLHNGEFVVGKVDRFVR